MTDAAPKSLFHPFEAGLLDAPADGARVLVLNAPASLRMPERWTVDATLQQDLRPVFLALRRGGHHVLPEADGEGHDLALVLLGRHRGQNELWLAEAIRRVRKGGRVVAAGGKTEGAASLRKRVSGLVELDGHASKHHGVVFWLTSTPASDAAADALEVANGAAKPAPGFASRPGQFSHDRIDPGSRLLAASLPANLSGRVADLGAGWGYLSVELARACPAVSSIDLFEASHAACACARDNLAALAPGVASSVNWHDVAAEPIERVYDVVVTNPPFHQGRAAEPGLGEAFIRAASKALKPGGRLYLVANRPLPYEAALAAGFAAHGEIVRDDRYKVLWARR